MRNECRVKGHDEGWWTKKRTTGEKREETLWDELHDTAIVYLGKTLSKALLMLLDERLVTLTEALYSSVVVLGCLNSWTRTEPLKSIRKLTRLELVYLSWTLLKVSSSDVCDAHRLDYSVWLLGLKHEDRGTEESSRQGTTRVNAGHLGWRFGGRLTFPPARYARGKDGGQCCWGTVSFVLGALARRWPMTNTRIWTVTMFC
jgi:hypothetical protein